MGPEDPRVGLRGGRGLRATGYRPAGAFLGLYRCGLA